MVKPNAKTNHYPTDPNADMESHSANASDGTHEAAQFNSLVRITFTHYRNRLVDPDGLSVKACLDGLVLAGILRDDSASCIEEIRHRQIKSNDEKTVIEIEEVKP